MELQASLGLSSLCVCGSEGVSVRACRGRTCVDSQSRVGENTLAISRVHVWDPRTDCACARVREHARFIVF